MLYPLYSSKRIQINNQSMSNQSNQKSKCRRYYFYRIQISRVIRTEKNYKLGIEPKLFMRSFIIYKSYEVTSIIIVHILFQRS